MKGIWTMNSTEVLKQLVTLSNNLGRPENDYVIMGEGNTSARLDDGTFWVKSSGTELRTITAEGFVRVSLERAVALATGPALADGETKEALDKARVVPNSPGRPSIETFLHAILLSLDGVRFVGHTHPVAVNSLTCSVAFPEVFKGRLFPDEIVFCGTGPLLVPYADPGMPLAGALKKALDRYMLKHGVAPRAVYMQNHGFIALGATAKQVEDTTAMAVKTARVLLATFAAGGPHYMKAKSVTRIHTRPDEHYRRQKLG